MFRAFISILVASFLFAESLLPQGEWSELNKLPALIHHFKTHQEINPAISFIDYIKLHYNDFDHHKEDQQTHHNLPLNHHNHNHPCCFQSLAITIPVVPVLNSLIPLREILAVEYKEPASSFFQTSIWQPPRI